MTASILVNRSNNYGAFELKQIYFRNFSIGIFTAIIFHFLIVTCFRLISNAQTADYGKKKIIDIGCIISPPVDLTAAVHLSIPANSIVAGKGIPVPVPNDQASQESSIISQKDYSSTSQPIDYEKIKVIGETKVDPQKESSKEEEPDSGTFIPYEQAPEPVYSAKVIYPELALKSGITGRVFLKVLIDRQGKPKRAIVYKSDSELFNQPAIDAAMASAFTPAIQNKQPISVWIVVPYRFTLEGQR